MPMNPMTKPATAKEEELARKELAAYLYSQYLKHKQPSPQKQKTEAEITAEDL
jgi:hypothetical protein